MGAVEEMMCVVCVAEEAWWWWMWFGLDLCTYRFRKGDLCALNWARVRPLM